MTKRSRPKVARGKPPAYRPRPIGSRVKLSRDLEELAERLVENAHDVWAKRRIKEGWTYGPRRDDKLKRHPDLVPYADLTKKEKAYDRDMVRRTLKAMLALGYRIEPPE